MFGLSKHPKCVPQITDKLLLQPAHKLSRQIKAGNLTSVQLVQAYIDRINQVQPLINAMCQDRFAEALAEARAIDELLTQFRSSSASAAQPNSPQPANATSSSSSSSATSLDETTNTQANDLCTAACGDFDSIQVQELLSSPLLGVPITIKESVAVKGMRNSCGLLPRRDSYADEDALLVAHLKKLGLVPIATSNIPEGTMYWADCCNPVYGRTSNPYDLSRITGASSGGEGALLGAGASLIGLGSDIGGSLRLPAHFCGINSHKSTPFLLPSTGNYPPIELQRLRLFSLGPMSRYASDLRPLLKCMLQRVVSVDDASLASSASLARRPRLCADEPVDIEHQRRDLLAKLDDPVDLSSVCVCYANFDSSPKLRGRVQREFIDAQQHVLDTLSSKYGCATKEISLDEFFDEGLETWQLLLQAAAAPETLRAEKEAAEQVSDVAQAASKAEKQQNDKDEKKLQRQKQLKMSNELKELLGVESVALETAKLLVGKSKHTASALLTLIVGMKMPKPRIARKVASKSERKVEQQRAKLAQLLGPSGCLLMPTMPQTAYKHHAALIRMQDLTFTAIFNSLQVPVSHATFGLARGLPFGFSCVSLPFNDRLTLALAETIELEFGGWREPAHALASTLCSTAASSLSQRADSLANACLATNLDSQHNALDQKADSHALGPEPVAPTVA